MPRYQTANDYPIGSVSNGTMRRASWPGMILSASEWQWFDIQDGETQRAYYRWATDGSKVEA